MLEQTRFFVARHRKVLYPAVVNIVSVVLAVVADRFGVDSTVYFVATEALALFVGYWFPNDASPGQGITP